MSSNSQIDQLEAYHLGRMSEEELATFENEIASNPSLKSESDFQSEVIEGIKLERKNQLKARLSGVDVAPGWLEFAQQSTLVKSFSGIAIATLVGTGVYLIADKNTTSDNEMIFQDEISVLENKPFDYTWQLPEQVNDVQQEIVPMVVKEDVVETQNEEQEESSQLLAEAVSTNEEFAPDFIAPSAGSIDEELAPKSNSLEEVPTLTKNQPEETPIEIETKNSRSSKIKYKYYDGKLYLDGDFNRKPYEILEINSAKARRIYLLHLGKYYEIKINDRLSELPEVKDLKLIEELQLIRANK